MDDLAQAVERLDCLRLPSDILFRSEGRRACRGDPASRSRAGRELHKPNLAL